MASIVNTSRIAVVGLGQLGSSLALRLKQLGAREVLAVSRRPESLQRALDLDMIDAGSTDAADVLPVVDLTFLCLPLSPTLSFVRENLEHFRFGSLVTDVGSVKGVIVDQLRPMLLEHGTYFVGSHPMAGSEKSGMEVARADLFEKAVVFMTPTEDDETDVINLISTFWRELGALPLELSAERHDQACAYSSHMTHLVSAAIAQVVLGEGDTEANRVACAGGFRDVTRIAGGNINMWIDICSQNREAILTSLSSFEKEIASVREALEANDMERVGEFLAAAKTSRDGWYDEYIQAKGATP